ncbi:hypothetical protein BH581_15630 [Vibrio splendidus]|nr:hypothetical protein BH581_15630 [Vibrio splendidus]
MKSGSFNKVISILAELTHHQLSLLKDRVDTEYLPNYLGWNRLNKKSTPVKVCFHNMDINYLIN